MIDFFINRIRNGLMCIEQVPAFWRAKVQEAVDAENAEGTEERI